MVLSIVFKFVSKVAFPTIADVASAKNRESEGGKKITPEEREEILDALQRRAAAFILDILPVPDAE